MDAALGMLGGGVAARNQGLRPDYRIVANDIDITATVRDRLMSLRYTDEAGMQSDVLEITLADHLPDAPIRMPPTGAELALAIGYDGQLQHVGMFVVDELEMAGWPGEMTIRAHAAVQDKTPKGKASLRTQKSREWKKDTTLGDIVKKVAGEHGLQPVVGSGLASIKLPHTIQADESDLHFLVRMARKYDAVVKPADGKLVLAKKGETKSASGQDMPTITLRPQDCSKFRVSISKRETAGQVVAYWHAVKQAKRHEVKVGSGEPVKRLKMYYPTAEMALAAARSELDKRERAKATVSITLPGRTDLLAEGKLVLAGFREGVDGEWSITKVEHCFNESGYVTTVEGEKPNEGGEDATEDKADE